MLVGFLINRSRKKCRRGPKTQYIDRQVLIDGWLLFDGFCCSGPYSLMIWRTNHRRRAEFGCQCMLHAAWIWWLKGKSKELHRVLLSQVFGIYRPESVFFLRRVKNILIDSDKNTKETSGIDENTRRVSGMHKNSSATSWLAIYGPYPSSQYYLSFFKEMSCCSSKQGKRQESYVTLSCHVQNKYENKLVNN